MLIRNMIKLHKRIGRVTEKLRMRGHRSCALTYIWVYYNNCISGTIRLGCLRGCALERIPEDKVNASVKETLLR